MKNLIILASVLAVASLTGCATAPQTSGTTAYTPPPTFNYNSRDASGLSTSNPGSMYSPTDSENGDL